MYLERNIAESGLIRKLEYRKIILVALLYKLIRELAEVSVELDPKSCAAFFREVTNQIRAQSRKIL